LLLNTIVKAVKRKSHRGSQSVTTDQITTDIVACINEAIRDVSKLLPKRYWFKQATVSLTVGVAGTPSTWSLASDCQEPILFHYTLNNSVYRLQKIDSDKEWIDRIWNVSQAVGQPRFFREIGPNSSTGYKQIEVFPIPDTSYTLNYEYYKTKGTDLTTSDLASEIPTIPDHVQDAIEKGALYYFLKGFDDSLQGIAKTDFEEAKISMEISDERDIDSDLRLRWNMGLSSNLPPNFYNNGR
jgi:hypothetical protein